MADEAQNPTQKFGNKWMKCEMKKWRKVKGSVKAKVEVRNEEEKREKIFEMFPGDGNHLGNLYKMHLKFFCKNPFLYGTDPMMRPVPTM